MKIHILAPIALSLGVGGALGMLMGGGFIHTILSRFLCLFIAAPALIMLILTVIDRLRRRDRPTVMSEFAVSCATVAVAILGFTGGGAAMHRYRESEVRQFVDQVLPLLDAHKKKSGIYPRSLREVTDKRLPRYMDERDCYTSTGASFTFYYDSPDEMISGLMLTASDRRWSRAD
jgi:hypothetical protein